MQFTKLFNSILDSTIWQEPASTKICWITMLAMSDRNGDVHAQIPGLARRAGITIDECLAAINSFTSPDPYSRTKDRDGKRLAEIDGGWTLLNHAKYRQLLSAEERREYNRRKQAERRERIKSGVSNNVKQCQEMSTMSTHTEAEAEAEAEAEDLEAGDPSGSGAPPQKSQKSKSKSKPTDAEWIASLKADAAYQGIDVDREHAKMIRWCETNRKPPTRRRLVAWLNRIDPPMNAKKGEFADAF
jgi:hypothetical protein